MNIQFCNPTDTPQTRSEDDARVEAELASRRRPVAFAHLLPHFIFGATLLALFSVRAGAAGVDLPGIHPSDWSRETILSERIYQSLHVVDTLQTYSMHNSPCFHEQDSAWLVDRNPNKAKTALLFGVGFAYAHALVSDALEDAPRWIRLTWQALSIGDVVRVVARNHEIGIRIGSANSSCGET